MARFDARPASDDVMRAIAHELAGAAPPPPDWNAVAPHAAIRAASDDEDRPLRPSRLLLVAAVVALVVGGLWYSQRPDTPVPADTPTDPDETSLATLPPVEDGFRSLDALSVQACLTRRNARLVLDNDLLSLEGRESLPGYTIDRARISVFRPIVSSWAGIVDHPDLDAGESAEIRSLLVAFFDADGQAFAGPDGTEGEGFGQAVDAFEDDLARHLREFDDPPECSSPGGLPTTSAVVGDGECVALWRLREAVGAFASSGRPDDDRVVETASEATRRWADTVPPDFAELGVQIDALLILDAGERDVSGLLDVIDDLLAGRTTDGCEPIITT